MPASQDEIMQMKMNATPKQQMFGNLWRLGAILNSAEFPNKDEAMRALHGAMSWEPVISSDQ